MTTSTLDELAAELGVDIPLISAKNIKKKVPSIYVSGHCNIGNHEGTDNRSPSGKEMKPCPGAVNWAGIAIICTCECHMLSRELENMAPMTAEEEDVFSSLSVSLASPKKKDGPAIPKQPAAESPDFLMGDFI